MTHKHHPGIESSWRIPLYRRHYIEIFVWVDKSSMYAADDYNRFMMGKEPDEHNFIGKATAGISAVRHTGKIRKVATPKKFGEIYLVSGNISARVLAHEIQHIVNYWIKGKYWDIDKMDERIATMTGEMHRIFWREYFKRYE